MGKFWKLAVGASCAAFMFASHYSETGRAGAVQAQPPQAGRDVPQDEDWTRCMYDSLVSHASGGLILPGTFDIAETECEPKAKLARAVQGLNRVEWFAMVTMVKPALIASTAQTAAALYFRR